VRSNVGKAVSDLKAWERRSLSAAGLTVESAAKMRTPVDTGRLRASITHEVGDGEVTIGTNMSYAGPVHNGARGREPRPFLVDGLLTSKAALGAIFKRPV
jgi:phage gpG-like protein